MKKSSSEQKSRIRKQFDSFCKTLLKNEMIDYSAGHTGVVLLCCEISIRKSEVKDIEGKLSRN